MGYTLPMPTLSQFFGITVRMYFRDHNPPHFHAFYGSEAAILDIRTLEVLEGQLSRRALRMVLEWAHAHRTELMSNWEAAQNEQPLAPIAPLE